MMHDKKKVAAVIIAMKNKNGTETQGSAMPEESHDEVMQTKMDIAKDLMAALESKSAHAVAMALQAFQDCCGEDAGESESMSESEKE